MIIPLLAEDSRHELCGQWVGTEFDSVQYKHSEGAPYIPYQPACYSQNQSEVIDEMVDLEHDRYPDDIEEEKNLCLAFDIEADTGSSFEDFWYTNGRQFEDAPN